MKAFRIADLILKSLKDELSEKEQLLLNEWRDASLANRNLYEKLIKNDFYVEKRDASKKFSNAENYDKIIARIRRNRLRKRVLYAVSYAAAVMLFVFGANFLWEREVLHKENKLFVNTNSIIPGESKARLKTSEGEIIDLNRVNLELSQQDGVSLDKQQNVLSYKKEENKTLANQKEKFNTLYVPKGGEYKLILADGTKVWLNSDSEIKYPVVFLKSKRQVFVSGEAYFEVAHDAQKPFVVHSDNMQVTVLGTEFNFRAYSDEKLVQTTLVKGSVEVGNATDSRKITPSQQFSYNKETEKTVIKKVDTYLYTSWKDGIFLFNRQTLGYILNDISRWYNVSIVYEDDALKSYLFSGRLKKYETANTLLDVFEDTGNVIFEKKNNTVYVRRKNEKL